MYPTKLIPAVKDYLWGGIRLKESYGIKTKNRLIAEAWMLSCNPAGKSIITEGESKGKSLEQAIFGEADSVIGSQFGISRFFPVLVKLIDAKQDLSVQVHPADQYALTTENKYGKAEIWYVLDASDSACVYAGFNKSLTRQELEESIREGTIMKLLKKIPVTKGDFIAITPGIVHAIGAGVLLAEVQQNSDITYRVYDFERKDPDGKLRELHIDKALDVIDLKNDENCLRAPICQNGEGFSRYTVSMPPYFEAYVYQVEEKAMIRCDESSFHSVVVLDGEGILSFSGDYADMDVKKGESIFLPAGTGEYSVYGNCDFLLTCVTKQN